MARPACGRSFLPRADKRVSSPKHFRWAPNCTTIWYWSSYRRGKLSCRGKLPTRIFVLLQPFPCREIMIIDLFLVALLSLVCLVLTDSSSLVTRLTEECHRSDGERSLEWQTPAVAYPFGSLHDLCVAVVVVLPDEVVRHFRQDLSILLIICHPRPAFGSVTGRKILSGGIHSLPSLPPTRTTTITTTVSALFLWKTGVARSANGLFASLTTFVWTEKLFPRA